MLLHLEVSMNRKKLLNQNIWKVYLHHIFTSAFFAIPIIVLFWQDNGLSMTEVMVLQSIFAITVVLLEVPTGYFADVFGRKNAILIGGFFYFFAAAGYSIGYTFLHFLIAELSFAIGISMCSGALSALVYDSLKDLERDEEYQKIWGMTLFYALISMAVADVIGGFVAEYSFRWTFYMTAFAMFFLIPISFSLTEPQQHQAVIKKGYMLELLQSLKFALINNHKLRWLLIYSGVIMGFNNAVVWLYQPYFQFTGLDVFYFGLVFASFNIVGAISSKYAHKIEKRLGARFSIVMLVFLVSASYLLMSNFVYLFSFSFAFLQQFVRGFGQPVFTDYIHKLTESRMRATILSVQNLMQRFIYALIIPILGWVTDVYTVIQALIVLGITTFVIGGITLVVLYKQKVI